MSMLDLYREPSSLPRSEAIRIGMLLGLEEPEKINEISLAERVSNGLCVDSAESLASLIGRQNVIGPVISKTTLNRAKKSQNVLSRQMSERLYEVSRVVDLVSRNFRGDKDAIDHFLVENHNLLGGKTPLKMAQSSSAGADAVVNLLRRAGAGIAV